MNKIFDQYATKCTGTPPALPGNCFRADWVMYVPNLKATIDREQGIFRAPACIPCYALMTWGKNYTMETVLKFPEIKFVWTGNYNGKDTFEEVL